MRKLTIFTIAAALLGTAALAQASDRSHADRDSTQITRAAANDRRDDDRYERTEQSRKRHDESRERRHDTRKDHDESKERHQRR